MHTTFSPFAFPRNKVNPIYSNGNSPSRWIPFTNCIITPSGCAFRHHVSARLPHNMTTSERPKHCTQVCNRSRTTAGVERDAPTSNRFPAFFFSLPRKDFFALSLPGTFSHVGQRGEPKGTFLPACSALEVGACCISNKHKHFPLHFGALCGQGARGANLLLGRSEPRVSEGEDPGQSCTTRMCSEETPVSAEFRERLS